MIAMFEQIVLSEWIWSVTSGTYQLVWNLFILIALFKFFLRIPMVSAVLLALASQIVSFLVFTLFALGTMYLLGKDLGPEQYTYAPGPLYASVVLGLIFFVLQSLFFLAIKRRLPVAFSWIAVLVFVSNQLAALFTVVLLSIE